MWTAVHDSKWMRRNDAYTSSSATLIDDNEATEVNNCTVSLNCSTRFYNSCYRNAALKLFPQKCPTVLFKCMQVAVECKHAGMLLMDVVPPSPGLTSLQMVAPWEGGHMRWSVPAAVILINQVKLYLGCWVPSVTADEESKPEQRALLLYCQRRNKTKQKKMLRKVRFASTGWKETNNKNIPAGFRTV